MLKDVQQKGGCCARQCQWILGFGVWGLAFSQVSQGEQSSCIGFDNRSSRSMYFGRFTRCLNCMSEESLYTKSNSQELGVTGCESQGIKGVYKNS